MAGNRPGCGAPTNRRTHSSALISVSLRWEVQRSILSQVSKPGRRHSSADTECSGVGAPALLLDSGCWIVSVCHILLTNKAWPLSWDLRVWSLRSLSLLQPCSFSVCSAPSIRFARSEGWEVLGVLIFCSPQLVWVFFYFYFFPPKMAIISGNHSASLPFIRISQKSLKDLTQQETPANCCWWQDT